MGTTYGPKRFTPLSLSPALWLSDTGSDPAVWEDLSGNGRNATQGTVANQPAIVTNALNGRQVRRFDGTNDFLKTGVLSTDIPQPVDWFIVFKSTNTAVRRVFDVETIDGVTGPRNTMFLNDSSSHIFSGTILTANFTFTTWGINHARFNGVNSFWIRNSITLASGDAGNQNCSSIVIGAFRLLTSDFFQGDIAEILVFPTALSTTNRRTVERYLAGKYGITIS